MIIEHRGGKTALFCIARNQLHIDGSRSRQSYGPEDWVEGLIESFATFLLLTRGCLPFSPFSQGLILFNSKVMFRSDFRRKVCDSQGAYKEIRGRPQRGRSGRQDGGLQETKPLQLSCYGAASGGVQLFVGRNEDNCLSKRSFE